MTSTIQSIFTSAAFLVITLLCGCSTASTTTPPVQQQPLVGADAARIFIIRPTGVPAGVKATIVLDGIEVGKLFVRRYAILNVNPGKHEIIVKFPLLAGVPSESVSLECDERSVHYLLYSTEMSAGAFAPAPVGIVWKVTPGIQYIDKERASYFTGTLALSFSYGRRARKASDQ